MLFLRYQRQQGDQEPAISQKDGSRKVSDRSQKNERHRAATRGTLICIFVCGSLLLSLGLVILFVGLYALPLEIDKTPWLVIGPTCIVVGILVLLLSVETIIKLRKISSSSPRSSAEPEVPEKTETKKESGRNSEDKVPKDASKLPVVQPTLHLLSVESSSR